MKKKKHGGKRSRAGRKPIDESQKKTTIPFYVQNFIVEHNGGIEDFKKMVYEFIETKKP